MKPFKGVSGMGEQAKKAHISAGLLAHVGASRREPHLKTSSPVQKPGFFHTLRKQKFFQRSEIPTYAVVSKVQKPQYMLVDF